jgi:hypothetical protein
MNGAQLRAHLIATGKLRPIEMQTREELMATLGTIESVIPRVGARTHSHVIAAADIRGRLDAQETT